MYTLDLKKKKVDLKKKKVDFKKLRQKVDMIKYLT